jgi:CubicO group peptidase (beta-lactamase class C family)
MAGTLSTHSHPTRIGVRARKIFSQFRCQPCQPARNTLALLAALAIATPALAQQKTPTAYERSIAAGYKALTLCSAMFNGGRTQAQVEGLELTGIYTDYQPLIPMLAASISRYTTKPKTGAPQLWGASVSVRFDQNLPPRRADWRHDRGCTILPPGSTAPSPAASLPSAPFTPFAGSMDDRPWPMGQAGLVPRVIPVLEGPVAKALSGGYQGRTTSVIVVQDGQIVAERYAAGFGPHSTQRTWSVAKSIAGTVAGIGVRQGLVRTAQPAGLWRGDTRATITLDNLLRMASGLHTAYAGNRTDALYFGGTTVDEEVAYWPIEAAPGTRFRYSNVDIVAASRVLRGAMKNDARYAAFPRTELFAKLGMTRTVAELDAGGNLVLSSQIWSSARDFARLGMFWLNDGVWQGQRILPVGWMKYMTTPSGPQPATGAGYGATLWLFGPAQGLPAGTFAAQGNRGQVIFVVPSRKIVVVRRGEDGVGSAFDAPRFVADVLKALP